MEKRSRINKFGSMFLFMVLLGVVLVLAGPTFHTSGTSSYLEEGQSPIFEYNFSANVTNAGAETLDYSIEEVNANLHPTENQSSFYSWIDLNASTGIMTINSTHDNESGQFNISITVLNEIPVGVTDVFYFYVNATNDAPNFTNISSIYNLTQSILFNEYIDASDEEEHYPLDFNISFFDNCTHASWSSRSNCSLFQFIDYSNTSGLMNYTPTRDDSGIYYANVTVIDYGENYTCSSGYCDPDYSNNQTTLYSGTVVFNVFSEMVVNVSNCTGRVFQENETLDCIINISTRESQSPINVSSLALLRNYDGNVSNSSWFYGVNQTNASNYSQTIYINMTPGKTEVGNWTINFTVTDLNDLDDVTGQIYILVNRSYNDLPDIEDISNITTSIGLLTTINISVSDDDFLIPDKNSSGGYNESLNFSVTILNQSDLTQELTLTGFDVEILNMPVNGTNRTEAKIEFTPNSSEAFNYTINITVNDLDNSTGETIFNITVINNVAPVWNNSLGTIFTSYEDNETYLNLSLNVSDPDGDNITFTYSNDTSFPNFSLSVAGIINFTSLDDDVGQHMVNITASDGYLTNTTLFNFTIYNVNDALYIENPIDSSDVINASVDGNSNINCTEDNVTTISLWIQDEDFKIPSGQKGFYNETLTINVTIEGPNTTLLTFSKNSAFPTLASNRSKYEAIFTPGKSDLGSYNITINVSDYSNVTDTLSFNLTIAEVQHSPVLVNLTNYTLGVNNSLYYIINATDHEDGNSYDSGNTNLTFRYNFVNGSDFINNNESIFNTTTGELNITFNSSQGGIYMINITVNDTAGSEDQGDFLIYVYDVPTINLPVTTYKFNLVENATFNLTFQLNHTVADNLTYLFYMGTGNSSVLRNSSSYFGNSTNYTFVFTPNFTDETSLDNFTLVAYTSNSEFGNASIFNVTRSWNITVNHSNFPLNFSGNIGGGDRIISGSSPQSVTLSDYFLDYDASDTLHNQTVVFTPTAYNATGGEISVVIINWTEGLTPNITFSSSSDGFSNYSLAAYEYNESNSSQIINTVFSNNFSVNLTSTTTEVATPSTGGGGGGGGSSTVPVAYKIISPREVSVYTDENITIPLKLLNEGSKTFGKINLTSLVLKDGENLKSIKSSFDKNYFENLKPKESKNFTLTVLFGEEVSEGDYEILVTATSKTPKYSDWNKIYVNLRNKGQTPVEKYTIFVDEFITENPACIELKEMINEAREYFDEGEYALAQVKAEEALSACEESIAQVSLPKWRKESSVNLYLFIAIFASFFLGVIYYSSKRLIIRRGGSFKGTPLLFRSTEVNDEI
jgi:hypothetical protein